MSSTTTRRATVEVFDPASIQDSPSIPSPSPSHIATDDQSVEHPAGAHDQIFFFPSSYMKVTVLFNWGALSDERLDVSFVSHSPY
jgi:hypothetical protein